MDKFDNFFKKKSNSDLNSKIFELADKELSERRKLRRVKYFYWMALPLATAALAVVLTLNIQTKTQSFDEIHEDQAEFLAVFEEEGWDMDTVSELGLFEEDDIFELSDEDLSG